jgi:uncharacterized Zn finger protein
MQPPSDPAEAPEAVAPPRRGGTVHSAVLRCEVCGEETPHRILHLDRRASPDRPSGVARCQVCRATHPFRESAPRPVAVKVIVSEGTESRAESRTLPSGTVLRLDEPVPGAEPELRVRRIDLPDGRAAPAAPVERIGAIWATVYRGATVPVSIVEGAHTESHRLTLPPEQVITVGQTIRIERETLVVAGLRARQRTWTREGDAFPADNVQRIYARRNRRPPAGSSAWSSFRESPRSWESATSASARSRSSPGVTRTRRSPRGANASAGATTHRSPPS